MLVSDNACIVFFSVYYILALNFQDSIYSHEVMVFFFFFFFPEIRPAARKKAGLFYYIEEHGAK